MTANAELEPQGHVSAIVPTFKRLDILPQCLTGIEAQRFSLTEIIVAYRPDDDPQTAVWLETNKKSHPLWVLVPLYQSGQVAALNAALAIAKGKILAIFDDDAVPRPDWLQKVLVHFLDESVAAAGGRDLVHGHDGIVTKPVLRKAGYRDYWGNVIGGHHLVVGRSREVDVLKGCNWALRRTALGTLHLDERLLGAGAQPANDYWLCLILRHAGWKIILDPEAIVDHYPGTKPDYQHGTWPRVKCFEWTANETATRLAFAPWHLKLRYILYHIAIGHRNCPGAYYVIHSVLRRPRSLPGQLVGGWSGISLGFRMAREFGRSPPGAVVYRTQRDGSPKDRNNFD
jgi:glycosyltransferase involved in cell wall biosynthesis